MGILKTLLTGGAFVGKICQTLSTAVSCTDKATGVTVALSPLSIGEVEFYKSNAANKDDMVTYAYNNSNEVSQIVSLPNIGTEGGASLELPKRKGCSIDNFISGNLPPETNLLIGPVTDSGKNENGNMIEKTLKVNITDIEVAGTMSVDTQDFQIKCQSTGLILLPNAKMVVNSLDFLSIKSYSGQLIIDQTIREVTPNQSKDNLQAYHVSIPFDKYGLKNGDIIKELWMTLKTTQDNVKDEQHKFHTLLPVEEKLIAQLKKQMNIQI